MSFMLDLSLDTSEKIGSLLVAAGTIAYAGYRFLIKPKDQDSSATPIPPIATVNQNQTVNVNISDKTNSEPALLKATQASIIDAQRTQNILFVDDDPELRISAILQRMGWKNVKVAKDIKSLTERRLTEANILFIDIQGVGRNISAKSEGLGLAQAIKERYPDKKVIIYSAHEQGDVFHEAWRLCDGSLPKTAEPFQFEEAILKALRQ